MIESLIPSLFCFKWWSVNLTRCHLGWLSIWRVCVYILCFFPRCVLGSLEGVFRLPRVLHFCSIRSPLHQEGSVDSATSTERTPARPPVPGRGLYVGTHGGGPAQHPCVLGDTTHRGTASLRTRPWRRPQCHLKTRSRRRFSLVSHQWTPVLSYLLS